MTRFFVNSAYNEGKDRYNHMKKTPLLFLFCLTASLLTGCGNDPRSRVSYKEATKEEFDTYYTSQKVSDAKDAFAERKAFYFVCDQSSSEFTYHLERYFDLQYYYEFADIKEGEETQKSHELYIGDDNTENCHMYTVDGEKQKVKDGNEALIDFTERTTYDRQMITRSIENPLNILEEYMETDNVTYYVGSNNTLKVSVSGDLEGTKTKGSVTVDKDTLLIYSVNIEVTYDKGTANVSYVFSYPSALSHKTPKDIGFNA